MYIRKSVAILSSKSQLPSCHKTSISQAQLYDIWMTCSPLRPERLICSDRAIFMCGHRDRSEQVMWEKHYYFGTKYPGFMTCLERSITEYSGWGTGSRMPGNSLPGFKLYRAARSISDNNAHDSIQPDIGIFSHVISSSLNTFGFWTYHTMRRNAEGRFSGDIRTAL